MAPILDTQKAVQQSRRPIRNQEAATANSEVVGEAQQDLVTKSHLEISVAHLERRMLILLLLQTGIFIAATAAIEVFLGS